MSLSENHDSEDAIDVALMMRVKHGDHQAFEQLVERYQDVAVGTVAKMLGNPSNAQDIAQQAFVRLWKAAPRYKQKAKFSTFFFTIIRNLVFNESKKFARRKTYSLEQREEVLFEQVSDDATRSPDAEAQQAELNKVVDQAIANLPDKQRMALVLRRYENMPYEEIAAVLKTSVSAVKSHLFRARATLKEDLSHYLDA
ncbi:RNA polymerase sigma factor [Rubritalea marina]|uniref:RNA polymerase sigma factor n=1 Tax=Rubritalea marina TaxID=361055 RepID=UPI0003A5D14C|nr:sigma-70 family RNA polymerase sigma factor [Rubritalea marina]